MATFPPCYRRSLRVCLTFGTSRLNAIFETPTPNEWVFLLPRQKRRLFRILAAAHRACTRAAVNRARNMAGTCLVALASCLDGDVYTEHPYDCPFSSRCSGAQGPGRSDAALPDVEAQIVLVQHRAVLKQGVCAFRSILWSTLRGTAPLHCLPRRHPQDDLAGQDGSPGDASPSMFEWAGIFGFLLQLAVLTSAVLSVSVPLVKRYAMLVSSLFQKPPNCMPRRSTRRQPSCFLTRLPTRIRYFATHPPTRIRRGYRAATSVVLVPNPSAHPNTLFPNPSAHPNTMRIQIY